MIDITILPYLQSLTANLQNDSTYFSVLWVDYRWFTINFIWVYYEVVSAYLICYVFKFLLGHGR